jgi:hypothetical protein
MRFVEAAPLKDWQGPRPFLIEIHLSMPDGIVLPIDDLSAAHERVLRTEGRRVGSLSKSS